MTLLPGDVILTGTPAGVGFTRKPPEFLQVRMLNDTGYCVRSFAVDFISSLCCLARRRAGDGDREPRTIEE